MLQHPDLSATLIDALRGVSNVNKDVCVPLRYASVLITKGFLCGTWEVGMIVGMHLRVVSFFSSFMSLNSFSILYHYLLTAKRAYFSCIGTG